ncbi:MAG: protein-L-isoaspartate(D-aspartate) O-methyltransferase [Candidatus Aenigmarchaeota archaeon]|nr:protein-L-isoaspartate(D-aspartate) O-methyltransferase [Candidatus Aenigmarchaeota archaeon]
MSLNIVSSNRKDVGTSVDKKLYEENKILVDYLTNIGAIKSEKVRKAFLNVPRHLFLKDKSYAYIDTPLPTLKGQTISQPSIVAIMLENLDLHPNQKVLEIGAGTGWNAALIGSIVYPGKVFTIEIEKELVEFAKENLNKLNIKNVEIIHGDGNFGYDKEAPYDRCIITAACSIIPPPLIEQLKKDGKLIAPIGTRFSQRLVLYDKNKNSFKDLGGCIFVELKGKYGFE